MASDVKTNATTPGIFTMIANASCVPIQDSDNGGARVTFDVANGSHFVEFAYREIGTTLGRFAPTEPNPFGLGVVSQDIHEEIQREVRGERKVRVCKKCGTTLDK